MTNSVSIIIPCYNEENAIKETVKNLTTVFNSSKIGYEIIVVNDGSTDNTANELSDLNSLEKLNIITKESNQGYGAAIKSALLQAKHNLVAITDADGTYPNDMLPTLVKECKNFDMVVGARTGEKVDYPLIRKIPKLFLITFMNWIVKQKIPDMNSGLRVFKKDIALKYYKLFPDGFSFTTTITICLLRNKYLVKFIPINYTKRIGKSKIHPIKDTIRFFQLILRTGMYFAPMRILSPIAAILFVACLGSLFYDIAYLKNLTDKTILLFLFALNTFMFSLLADMIDKRS